MDQIELLIWKVERFATPQGAVDFPIEVQNIILRFSVKFTGNPAVFHTLYNPSGDRIFSKSLGLFQLPDRPPQTLKFEGEDTFGLRIDRPGRYTSVAEFNGQRIGQSHFHIRQFPSIRWDADEGE